MYSLPGRGAPINRETDLNISDLLREEGIDELPSFDSSTHELLVGGFSPQQAPVSPGLGAGRQPRAHEEDLTPWFGSPIPAGDPFEFGSPFLGSPISPTEASPPHHVPGPRTLSPIRAPRPLFMGSPIAPQKSYMTSSPKAQACTQATRESLRGIQIPTGFEAEEHLQDFFGPSTIHSSERGRRDLTDQDGFSLSAFLRGTSPTRISSIASPVRTSTLSDSMVPFTPVSTPSTSATPIAIPLPPRTSSRSPSIRTSPIQAMSIRAPSVPTSPVQTMPSRAPSMPISPVQALPIRPPSAPASSARPSRPTIQVQTPPARVPSEPVTPAGATAMRFTPLGAPDQTFGLSMRKKPLEDFEGMINELRGLLQKHEPYVDYSHMRSPKALIRALGFLIEDLHLKIRQTEMFFDPQKSLNLDLLLSPGDPFSSQQVTMTSGLFSEIVEDLSHSLNELRGENLELREFAEGIQEEVETRIEEQVAAVTYVDRGTSPQAYISQQERILQNRIARLEEKIKSQKEEIMHLRTENEQFEFDALEAQIKAADLEEKELKYINLLENQKQPDTQEQIVQKLTEKAIASVGLEIPPNTEDAEKIVLEWYQNMKETFNKKFYRWQEMISEMNNIRQQVRQRMEELRPMQEQDKEMDERLHALRRAHDAKNKELQDLYEDSEEIERYLMAFQDYRQKIKPLLDTYKLEFDEMTRPKSSLPATAMFSDRTMPRINDESISKQTLLLDSPRRSKPLQLDVQVSPRRAEADNFICDVSLQLRGEDTKPQMRGKRMPVRPSQRPRDASSTTQQQIRPRQLAYSEQADFLIGGPSNVSFQQPLGQRSPAHLSQQGPSRTTGAIRKVTQPSRSLAPPQSQDRSLQVPQPTETTRRGLKPLRGLAPPRVQGALRPPTKPVSERHKIEASKHGARPKTRYDQ